MKTLTAPTFWLLLAIVAIGSVIILFRSHARREWGFKELLKNPKQWNKDIERTSRTLEHAAEEAKHWNEAQITAEVNRFVFETVSSEEVEGDATVLESLGPRIHASVLEILGDNSRRARLVVPNRTNLVPEAPFNRACMLLGDAPPVSAAALIAPFMDESSKGIRKDAALALGKIGSPDVVVPLRKAFADSDEYVRSYGLMGLEWAIKNGRLHEQCARDLYDDIAQLVVTGKNDDKSAELLLEIDQERATELFLSEKIFTSKAPSLYEALKALGKKRIPVARDRLLKLIADLEKGDLKYPRSCTQSSASPVRTTQACGRQGLFGNPNCFI